MRNGTRNNTQQTLSRGTRGWPTICGGGPHSPVAGLLRLVGEIYDVAVELLLVAVGGGEIEHVVGVDVLFVETIVVHGAVDLGIAETLVGCRSHRGTCARIEAS